MGTDLWPNFDVQDQTRTPRFDLYPFPNCASKYGELDLEDVTLPQDQSFYLSLDTRFDRLVTQLEGAPYNVNDRTKKYLIYYDAPVSSTNVCGQGGGFSNLIQQGGLPGEYFVEAANVTTLDRFLADPSLRAAYEERPGRARRVRPASDAAVPADPGPAATRPGISCGRAT